jgi:hypothetical protein
MLHFIRCDGCGIQSYKILSVNKTYMYNDIKFSQYRYFLYFYAAVMIEVYFCLFPVSEVICQRRVQEFQGAMWYL